MGNYTIVLKFENPRRGRQARNFSENDPKILDLKSSPEQIIFRKLSLGAPDAGSCKKQITCECHFNKRLFTFAARKINIGKFQHKKTNVMVVTDVAVSKRVLFSW